MLGPLIVFLDCWMIFLALFESLICQIIVGWGVLHLAVERSVAIILPKLIVIWIILFGIVTVSVELWLIIALNFRHQSRQTWGGIRSQKTSSEDLGYLSITGQQLSIKHKIAHDVHHVVAGVN